MGLFRYLYNVQILGYYCIKINTEDRDYIENSDPKIVSCITE